MFLTNRLQRWIQVQAVKLVSYQINPYQRTVAACWIHRLKSNYINVSLNLLLDGCHPSVYTVVVGIPNLGIGFRFGSQQWVSTDRILVLIRVVLLKTAHVKRYLPEMGSTPDFFKHKHTDSTNNAKGETTVPIEVITPICGDHLRLSEPCRLATLAIFGNTDLADLIIYREINPICSAKSLCLAMLTLP